MYRPDFLEKLEKRYEEFIVPLRMGDGFCTDSFAVFCQALSESREVWAEDESIPKRAVMILVDAHSAMSSASFLYNEPERENIEAAADKMCDLIRQSLE